MSENQEIVETPVVVSEDSNDLLDKAKGFWSRFSKPIIVAGSAIIIAATGWIAYKKLVVEPKIEKSDIAIFPAETLFDKMTQIGFNKDSITQVLQGKKGEFDGVLKIAKDYSGTPAANLAHYIAGACYLHNAEFSNAIQHLNEFSTNAKQIQSAAYRMLGDASAELKKNDDAASYYKKAVDIADAKDEFTLFTSLSKAGMFSEKIGKTKEAIEYYQKIKDNISPNFIAQNGIDFQVDKYLARLGVTN